MFIACQLEGIEVVMITIILPILIEEWELREAQKIMLTQSLFLGIMAGLLLGGYLGDKKGRKFTMNLGISICLLFGYLSALASTFPVFLMLRFVTTLGVGLIQSNISTIISETFLQRQKGSA